MKRLLLLLSALVLVSPSRALFAQVEGLAGYVVTTVDGGQPNVGFGFGFSFYASVYPLTAFPMARVQLGSGTWFFPDNQSFANYLCPVGTYARDNWSGPPHNRDLAFFRDVFQSLEGGIGQWVVTGFPSTLPKFRANAVPDCYDTQISSPGWSFGGQPLPADKLGLVQLSNRLALPPDGLPFTSAPSGALFGYGWMALPLIPAYTTAAGAPTGGRNLTLFFRAANFAGPVAFMAPEQWSALSATYPTIDGRGHDTRRGFIGTMALEIGETPAFIGHDANGVEYRRVPRLTFDADSSGRAVLLQDVKLYSQQAIWDPVALWKNNGQIPNAFVGAGIFTAPLQGQGMPLTLGGDPIIPDPGFLAGAITTSTGAVAFGMRWSGGLTPGALPEYFRSESGSWRAIPASSVPIETGLAAQSFSPQPSSSMPPLDTSPGSPWASSGWSAGPFTSALSDGSFIEYVWYRFIDQPAIVRLGLGTTVLQGLQAFVESVHDHTGLNGITIPPPSSGSLATLDPGVFVTPPVGFDRGYVPIVIRQYKPASLSAVEMAALQAFYAATNGDSWIPASNWFTGTPDTWRGLTVVNDRVVRIDLLANNLTGSLPPEIGDLRALQHLELSQNHLTGSLPQELGQLVELQHLSAFGNDLTGSIPNTLGSLTKLTTFEVGNNQLTGTIPGSLGSLSAIRHLSFAGNHLSGLIPAQLGSLVSLTALRLSQTDLSGPLPSSLAALTALQTFEFNGTTVCVPVDAALQAWLASIANLSSTNQNCAAGTVQITAAVKATGVHAPGVRYLDLAFTNTGTSYALGTTVATLTFRTLGGTGTVSLSGSLPIQLPTIPPGGSTLVRLYLNVPSTVTRFSLTEGGTFSDVLGTAFKFSLSQSVIR